MRDTNAIRLFGLNNLSIEAEIRRLEAKFDIDFGHRQKAEHATDDAYYPQFRERLRTEATSMAAHYAIFYCLENFIRELVVQRLEEEHGAGWWDIAVPEAVRKNADGNRRKEAATGVTPRSSELIDYSNFGELGEVLKTNWTIFGDMFQDIRAVERVLSNLNTLRVPIAHCKALAEDEVLRLT
jgi:hypothetical protein